MLQTRKTTRPPKTALPAVPFPTSASVKAAQSLSGPVRKPSGKQAAKAGKAAALPAPLPPFVSRDAALQALWQQWQPGVARDAGRAADAMPPPIDLLRYAPASKPFSSGKGKAHDKALVSELAQDLDGLQNVFYADRRFKLLVILQGMDAAGKDGTLRGVFSQMTPLGVRTVGWKAPTETEKARDYLWRIHLQAPASGEIVVFNRSHYEDVLVPVVNRWITLEQQAQRYAQINDFERMLSETGTVVVKFMLHISKEEQRQRLQERLDDPTKHWKFDEGDLQVRAQWDDYQQAYARLLAATHTPWAPWTIVPADSKTHRNLMIATLLREVLHNLGLQYPPGAPALDKIKVK